MLPEGEGVELDIRFIGAAHVREEGVHAWGYWVHENK